MLSVWSPGVHWTLLWTMSRGRGRGWPTGRHNSVASPCPAPRLSPGNLDVRTISGITPLSSPVKSLLYMCLASTSPGWDTISHPRVKAAVVIKVLINRELFDAKCAAEKSKTIGGRIFQEASYFEEQRKWSWKGNPKYFCGNISLLQRAINCNGRMANLIYFLGFR